MTAAPDIDWDYFGRRFLAYLKENRISFRQATKMCGTSHCTLHRCTHACSAQVAWSRQPRENYQLPPAIRSIVPEALLPAPEVEAVCATCGKADGHSIDCPDDPRFESYDS